MAIANQFVKNLKVVLNKKVFTHDEIKIIVYTAQEVATLSVLEFISLLDNLEILAEESTKKFDEKEFNELKSELLEE